MDFICNYRLFRYNDLQEIILDRLERELPSNLYYHNLKHTLDVITGVELIGNNEGLDKKDILLLKTAALFHDSGHIIAYENHEAHGAVLAKQYMPDFGYTPSEIQTVCRLIMSTKMPPRPSDILEKIMCDADLDYLGRKDFIPVSDNLYRELAERGLVGDKLEWNKIQIEFITNHQYFTETASKLREVNKQEQVTRLDGLVNQEDINDRRMVN